MQSIPQLAASGLKDLKPRRQVAEISKHHTLSSPSHISYFTGASTGTTILPLPLSALSRVNNAPTTAIPVSYLLFSKAWRKKINHNPTSMNRKCEKVLKTGISYALLMLKASNNHTTPTEISQLLMFKTLSLCCVKSKNVTSLCWCKKAI